MLFKQQFSVFKQYYTYFHTLFHTYFYKTITTLLEIPDQTDLKIWMKVRQSQKTISFLEFNVVMLQEELGESIIISRILDTYIFLIIG